jgi:transcriptional regulator with XRE-family HTH domain
VDVSLVIKQRLDELGLDQRDLASATHVTESYVSQLLTRKKAPPAPGRTAIYDKIGEFLKLPAGELSRLANLQRQEELKKRVIAPPRPLFLECRDLILRKCEPAREKEIRRIFEKEPFGELERLVTQKLLDVAQNVAREELSAEDGRNLTAQVSARSYENCVPLLDSIIHSWDMDLMTFAMEVVVNRRTAAGSRVRFEFTEQEPPQSFALEPGFEQFLNDKSLSGDATEREIEFLKTLHVPGRHPAPLYYYRELQNLRDPLHFWHED